MNEDHYKTLGIDFRAGTYEIRQAYYRLARRLHPDLRGGDARSADELRRVIDAYEILGNPERRRHYDALRRRDEEERLNNFAFWEQARRQAESDAPPRAPFAQPPPPSFADVTATPFTAPAEDMAHRHRRRRHEAEMQQLEQSWRAAILVTRAFAGCCAVLGLILAVPVAYAGIALGGVAVLLSSWVLFNAATHFFVDPGENASAAQGLGVLLLGLMAIGLAALQLTSGG